MNLKKINVTIDYSEYYDFELLNDVIEKNIDVNLDLTEYYDFELSDVNIDLNSLIEMTPICIDCNDAITSIDGEYGFLLTDYYEYIITKDGGYLQYH